MMDVHVKAAFRSLQRIKTTQSEISSILEMLEDQVEELRDLYDDIDGKIEDFLDQSQDLMKYPAEYKEYQF